MNAFKIIVQPGIASKYLLQYISQNIASINELGIKLVIEKIDKHEFDKDLIYFMRSKGITRLPALIAPNGKISIGNENIINIFQRSIKKNINNKRFSPHVLDQSSAIDDSVATSEEGMYNYILNKINTDDEDDISITNEGEQFEKQLKSGLDRGRIIHTQQQKLSSNNDHTQRRMERSKNNMPQQTLNTQYKVQQRPDGSPKNVKDAINMSKNNTNDEKMDLDDKLEKLLMDKLT